MAKYWLLAACIAVALFVNVQANGSSSLDTRISHSFYFESHGRDDIREWRATILKGAQYLKIDMNFITDADLCRQQTQLPRTYNFSLGCFVLVHSFSNVTFWGTPAHTFNTSLEIATWLLDDHNLDVIMLRPLVFQMCLKGKPNLCDGSSKAAQWIRLVDDFYKLIQPIVSSARIRNNVQFVFDQLNKADQCVLERWRPWNSTWVGEAGTGEDNNDGTNITFQMVNMATDYLPEWQLLNDTRMGKFNNGSYAIVAWEPVDEDVCVGFFEYFRTFQYANPAGTILAYNADPSLFHTFTASQTDRYSHFPFGAANSLTPVTWYSDELGLLFTVSLDNSGRNLTLTIHERQPRGQFIVLSSSSWVVNAESTLLSLGGTLKDDKSVLLVAAMRNGLLYLIAAHNVTSVSLLPPVPYTSNPAGTADIGVGFLDAKNNTIVLAIASVNSTTTDLSLRHVLLATDGTLTQLSINTVATGLPTSNLEGIAVAATWNTTTSGDWMGVVISWASERSVYGVTVTGAFLTNSGLTGIEVQPPLGTPFVKIGVGRNPSAVLLTTPNNFGSGAKLLVSYGWSFCYNSEYIDDDMVTMTAEKICDLRDNPFYEITESPVNSYVFTTFQEFQSELAQYGTGHFVQHLNGFATTCSDTIFHGVFDIGYNATVALVPRSHDDVDIMPEGFLGIAVLTSISEGTLSSCGNPTPHSGAVVLDSFPLFGFYNESALD